MPVMPAVCETCTTIFPSGFSITNGRGVFVGSKSGPCPNCGGWGYVPDGDFMFYDNVIQILSAPERTLIQLKRLAKVLERSQKNDDMDVEEIAKAVQEEIPELAPFTSQLKNIDYKFWISILLSTIYFLIPYITSQEDEIKEINYNQVINHVYETNVKVIPPQPVQVEKIGRNEVCYCGSSLKYKHCHGK